MLLCLLGWLLRMSQALLVSIILWVQLSMGICTSKKKLTGKVVVVTGASAGIGMEAARDLAARGARVIMACRNKEKAQRVARDIQRTVPGAELEVMVLNLDSFDSVKDFAAKLHGTVHKVDILLNNAGVTPVPDLHLSKDMLDPVIQTNHLSHFLLTNLIKDLIVNGEDKRIVNVSSVAAGMSPPIEFGKLKKGEEYDRDTSYAVSKLMNVLFSKEIVRRWHNEGITSYSLHPGLVNTEILSKADLPKFKVLMENEMVWALMKMIGRVAMMFFGKTSLQGAQTSIYCCLEDNLKDGEFYSDCRVAPWYMRNKLFADETLAVKLWQESERIVGL